MGDDVNATYGNLSELVKAVSSKRETAANALDFAATRLHDGAASMNGGRIAGLADRTASALDSTGRYAREMESRDVLIDLGEIAKRQPGKSLLAAIAIGFFVGRSLSRPQS